MPVTARQSRPTLAPLDNMAARGVEEVPVSIETVRRRVIHVVQAVERETATFTERYLGNVGDTSRWLAVVKVLCDRSGRQDGGLTDFKDLDPILTNLRRLPEVADLPEFAQLRRMVERGKMYEYIAFSLRNDLVDVIERSLAKFCVSFAAEANGEELRTVRDYESKIIEWNKDIKTKLDAVDTVLDEGDKYKSPLTRYMADYGTVLGLMGECCRAMARVCEPVRRWVTADSLYARRVQEEINQYNKRKMEMRDVTQQLRYQRDQLGHKLRRRAFFALRVERALQDAREEKRGLKRREATLRENRAKTEGDVQRKRRDLEEVKDKLRSRKENSPTVFNYLSGMVEALREDIWRLEGKLDTMESQTRSLAKQQTGAQREVDRLMAQLEASNTGRDQQLSKIQRQEYRIKLLDQDLADLHTKVTALKQIRELKLHSDTLRKIAHYGYNPGQMREYRDELEEAFRIAADDIGKDWTWLYQKLPFMPPRDFRERTQDIEVIDMSHRRVPGSFPLLALRGLEKWRRLSTTASLPDLLATLRRLRKRDTVTRIQRQLRTNSAQ